MITKTTSSVTYQGNGSTAVFPFGFLILDESHLIVTITDNTKSPPVSVILNPSQFGVTGIGGDETGGAVTYPKSGQPLSVGWSITISRIVPYKQETSYPNQGGFYPEVVEASFDYLTMAIQQLANGAYNLPLLLVGLSGSTITVGVGVKTWAVQSGLSFRPGSFVVAADLTDPTGNWMHGQVIDYSDTTLTVNVLSFNGAGSPTTWCISLAGPQGIQGTPGDIAGPSSAINENIPVFDGPTGKLIKDSGIPVSGVASIIGSAKNLRMVVLAASATATLTADEIVVKTALGGVPYFLANVNRTIDLTKTGPGGMDVGQAPVSGFVALYAIYNRGLNIWAFLARDATNIVASEIYDGSSMPNGYTASALVSVWPTNGTRQFIAGYQIDRRAVISPVKVLNGGSVIGNLTAVSLAVAIPKNAKSVKGSIDFTSATTNTWGQLAAENAVYAPFCDFRIGVGAYCNAWFDLPILTAQTMYYLLSGTSGSLTLWVSAYTI